MTWSEAMEIAHRYAALAQSEGRLVDIRWSGTIYRYRYAALAQSEGRRLRVCGYRDDDGRWQYTVQRTPVPELVPTT